MKVKVQLQYGNNRQSKIIEVEILDGLTGQALVDAVDDAMYAMAQTNEGQDWIGYHFPPLEDAKS